MNPFILYQLKVALCIGAFTSLYYVLFRKETYHRFNRFYLVASLLLSLVLPLLQFHFSSPAGNNFLPVWMKTVTVVANRVSDSNAQSTQPVDVLLWLYFLFTAAFAIYLLWQLSRMLVMVIRHGVSGHDGIRLVRLPDGNQSFSFFNLVFIHPGGSKPGDQEQMIRHEQAHARQFHSADVMLVQCIKICQWFNPFIYLIEKTMQETHEYLADKAVLEQDGNGRGYRLLLLSQVFGVQPGIFSFFNHSRIKNRILMMTKQKSPSRNRLKYLAALPLLLLLFFVMCCNLDKNAIPEDLAPPPPPPPPPVEAITDGDGSFIKVDEQALFQGGDIDDFRKWVQSNLAYPEDAIKNGVFGRVTVQFSVSETGKIGDVKVLRGVYPSLDKETVRVIESSPDWLPAKAKGKDVKQQFVMPVVFMLKE